jgi:crotonobetainyl-CoA:carnitine CoA-transferase CaiB-like acyl-CoA transferase
MNQSGKPLRGTRILDLTRLLPGPMATLHLADLGAEVIKIEDPAVGDYARSMGVMRAATTQMFLAINRNKRFVTLDLKDPRGREQFTELVRGADGLIEGFRPGVMARLGFGWDDLQRINPRLVLCSISGYGQDGPLEQVAGHDINYLSLTGVLEQTVGRDGTPAIPALQIADLLGGAQSAVIGVLAALIEARASGRGQWVDVSMTDAVFAHYVAGIAAANVQSAERPGLGLLTGGVACYNIYRTADARHVAVGALEAKFWDLLCEALGRPELCDAHWARGQVPGSDAALATRAELDRIFATASMVQWIERLAGVDCCVTPILSAAEALVHPLFKARRMVVDLDDPIEGSSRFAALPIRFSGWRFDVERGAQAAGHDNQAILPHPRPS